MPSSTTGAYTSRRLWRATPVQSCLAYNILDHVLTPALDAIRRTNRARQTRQWSSERTATSGSIAYEVHYRLCEQGMW